MASFDSKPTSSDSKLSNNFTDGVLAQNSACFTSNGCSAWKKNSLSKKNSQVVMLPTPYSDGWQGWATEKKNFKRCGNPKCQTRQKNGRGFTCWVPGCRFVFKTTIAAKRKYYSKNNPAPDDYQQIRKKMRKKYNKKKSPSSKRANKPKKSSPSASAGKKVAKKKDDWSIEDMLNEFDSSNPVGVSQLGNTELSFDSELFNDETSSFGLISAPNAAKNETSNKMDSAAAPKLTRSDSFTPIEDIVQNKSTSMADTFDVQFNYEDVPIPELSVDPTDLTAAHNSETSAFGYESALFDEFLAEFGNDTCV